MVHSTKKILDKTSDDIIDIIKDKIKLNKSAIKIQKHIRRYNAKKIYKNKLYENYLEENGLFQCYICKNIWDGNAQCSCFGSS